METKSREQMISCCQEIETLLANALPGVDDARLARIKSVCSSMDGDSNVREKANRLSKRADIYFSDRRHLTYHGGAEAIMHEMRFSLLHAIRDQVS